MPITVRARFLNKSSPPSCAGRPAGRFRPHRGCRCSSWRRFRARRAGLLASPYKQAESLAFRLPAPQRLSVQVGDASPFCRHRARARHPPRSRRYSSATARMPVAPRRSSAGPEASPSRKPGRQFSANRWSHAGQRRSGPATCSASSAAAARK